MTHKKSIISLVLLVSVLVLPCALHAQEAKQQADAAVIGIVNLLEIQTKAKLFKDIRRQRDEFASKYLEEAKETETELKKRDQELLRQLPKMSEEEAREKSKEFKEDLMTFRHKNDVKRERLNDAYMMSMTQAQFKKLAPIIQEVALERGMNMVMNKTQFLHHKADLEITEEVLKRMDKRHPSVDFVNPDTLDKTKQ